MDEELKDFIRNEIKVCAVAVIAAIERCADRELSIEESACYLNVGRTKIYSLLRDNKISSIRHAGHKQSYIKKSVLDDYIKSVKNQIN